MGNGDTNLYTKEILQDLLSVIFLNLLRQPGQHFPEWIWLRFSHPQVSSLWGILGELRLKLKDTDSNEMSSREHQTARGSWKSPPQKRVLASHLNLTEVVEVTVGAFVHVETIADRDQALTGSPWHVRVLWKKKKYSYVLGQVTAI